MIWILYCLSHLGSIPGLGRSPREGNSYPLQNSGLENSIVYYSPIVHGVAKSRTQLNSFHFHFHQRSHVVTHYVSNTYKGKTVTALIHTNISLNFWSSPFLYFYIFIVIFWISLVFRLEDNINTKKNTMIHWRLMYLLSKISYMQFIK